MITSMKPMPYTRDQLVDLLRRHDIKPTHQRIEIAHALFARGEHLSADRILAIVNDRHSETSKATVYNTLNLFLEKKLPGASLKGGQRYTFESLAAQGNTAVVFWGEGDEVEKLVEITPVDSGSVRVADLSELRRVASEWYREQNLRPRTA